MTLVWFALLVGLLITVHELGHFVMARLFGVRVLKLAIGFGRPILRFRRRETGELWHRNFTSAKRNDVLPPLFQLRKARRLRRVP